MSKLSYNNVQLNTRVFYTTAGLGVMDTYTEVNFYSRDVY